MDEQNRFNRPLDILVVHVTEQHQLQMYQQSQNTSNQDTPKANDSHANLPGIGRHSTNSLSSISHATQQTVVPALNFATDTDSISKVINICNEIDAESNCITTETLVRNCIRNQIWSTNKFITDNTIKHMKIENRSNSKSVLNILLKYTRKNDTLNNMDRLKFWKKYGPVVQLEVNVLKTITTRAIKDEIMIGKQV